MVLRQPETPIPPALSVLRKIKGMMQSVSRYGALSYECQVKD
jgi:hypothetical protein